MTQRIPKQLMDSAQRNRIAGERLSFIQSKLEKRQRFENSEIADNHPTFMKDQLMEFYDLFDLYSNKQSGRIDINDILATARTLGLDEKYQMVYKVLSEIQKDNHDEAKKQNINDHVDLESFIDLITQKLGNINDNQGREAIFKLLVETQVDDEIENNDRVTAQKLQKIANDLRYNLSEEETEQIIHNVAGFSQNEFDFESQEVEKKMNQKKDDQKRDLFIQFEYFDHISFYIFQEIIWKILSLLFQEFIERKDELSIENFIYNKKIPCISILCVIIQNRHYIKYFNNCENQKQLIYLISQTSKTSKMIRKIKNTIGIEKIYNIKREEYFKSLDMLKIQIRIMVAGNRTLEQKKQ